MTITTYKMEKQNFTVRDMVEVFDDKTINGLIA